MVSNPENIRFFIAVELSDQAREEAQGVAESVSRFLPGIKTVAPEQMHVTLKFLGDLDKKLVCRLVDQLG